MLRWRLSLCALDGPIIVVRASPGVADRASCKSRDRTTANQATTQATPAAPMTRNGSRQPPVEALARYNTTIGVAIAPRDAPLWMMLLPSGRSRREAGAGL